MVEGKHKRLTPRERRQRVMLPARMRSQAGWSDACILNISPRGLLIYSSGSALPGSSVEVRRGGQLVVARVVWRKNQRIGLCSNDPVHVEDIITAESAAAAVRTSARELCRERRRLPRHEAGNRARGRALEFIITVLVGASLAFTAMLCVRDSLAKPLAKASEAMGTR